VLIGFVSRKSPVLGKMVFALMKLGRK